MSQAKIVITAVDNASATMLRIRAQMRALTQPMRDIKASFGRFAEASGLKAVGRDMQKIARVARSVAGGITRIIAPMGALIGVGTLAGVGELAKSWANLGWNVGRTARTIGVAPQKLMALQGAAKLAGLSAQDMTSSLGALGMTLQDAQFGRNQKALAMLNKFGITTHRTATGAVDTARALSDLSTVIQGYNGQPQVQQHIADQFGVGALLPLLRQGPAAMRAYEAEARRLGYVLSGPVLKNAEALGLSFARLDLSMIGLRNSIADALYPVLQPMLGSLVQWISANRQLIGQQLGQWVRDVVQWVRSVNWRQVGADIVGMVQSITSIARGINDAVQSLGGWKNALELAFGAWAVGKLGLFTLGVIRLSRELRQIPSLPSAPVTGAARAAAAGDGAAAGAAASAASRLLPWMRWGGVGGALLLHSPTIGQGEESSLAARRNSLPARQQYALWRLQQMGLSPIEASGLAANFTAESGLSSTAVGDNGAAYGIGQWHADRQAQFAKLFGIPIQRSTLDEQLAFARWELGNTEAGAQARAAKAKTAAEAGSIYSRYYERPADADQQARTRGLLAGEIYDQNRMMFASAPTTQKVHVEVSMKNMPPGTRVEARDEKGAGVPVRVAYNMVGQ